VALWDLEERRQVAALPGGTLALAFHPRGGQLAVATLKQTVRVWEVPGGRPVAELIGHLDVVTCLAYSPDGRWLATGGDDRTVRLWDPGTGVQLGLVELDTQVKALCFAPDGRTLYSGNGNTSCYRLDLEQLLAGRGA
jgi:WD40 repeat protein